MTSIKVRDISKRFGETQAVNGVSFEVRPGEIFGLLGPNGAGKTTTIRIILDIFKPDSGSVSILGGEMSEEKKNQIGYLPEERGLYQDIPLERCLLFLALLKGMTRAEADSGINNLLERFDLNQSRKKKVKELSKGMQQKAQLITALVHDPALIIIDEPFNALDPINTQMVKDLLSEQRDQGKTIVMCTHQMNQVEQLCDRLVLIDRGKVVLRGTLKDIRKRFASNNILVRSLNKMPTTFPGVEAVEPYNDHYKMILKQDATPQSVLKKLVEEDIMLEEFEIAVPSLDEIFIKVVENKGEENE